MHTVRPNGGGSSNWKRCEIDNCLGAAVVQNSHCIRHVDDVRRNDYLNTLCEGRGFLSLQGVEITQELMDYILRSAIVKENTLMVPLSLAGADISARLDFSNYIFPYHFNLSGAIVHEATVFNKSVFKESITAQFTFFNAGPPSFTDTTFYRAVDLSYVHADRVSIGFSNCSFAEPLKADGIHADLLISRCRFESDLSIRAAKASIIRLDGCSIDGELNVGETHCAGFLCTFLRAEAAHQIGPIDVENYCTLTHARFSARVQINVRAQRLDMSGAQLVEGGHVLVDRARIYLNQVSTGRHLRISGVPTAEEKPVIMELQDADTGLMSFAHVDMSCCVFYGAHDLGKIVIEPTVKFSTTPSWWHSKRHCVADEFAWRLQAGGFFSKRWILGQPCIADDQGQPITLPTLHASQVAAVYRDLRRSFEAAANEPGAADFYYGEMEMRRRSREARLAERMIIWLYWIVSGYSLRASRAFIWLLALITGGAAVMVMKGFAEGPATYLNGLMFSIRAALPGIENTSKLTTTGEIVEIVMTLLGPVLFALALLALRGRVKR